MVRENPGYDVASESEYETLCAAARAFDELGVDGLVLGFQRSGHLDLASTERVLGCVPGLQATFHRAFEALEAPEAAIAALKKSGRFDRILTSGDSGRLREYASQAAPEISIVAGGGMSAESIRTLIATTPIREFHVGRAARHGASIHEPVDAARVRSLAALLSA
jgi:copper homeostasis protein CutC